MIGLISLVSSVSLAALIFTNNLSAYLSVGVSMMLLTAMVAGFLFALNSSCHAVIAIPQDRIAPITAVMAATISTTLVANGNSSEQILTSVILAIIITTLLTGLFLFLLGYYRVGFLVRYFPLSVIGGFLAGTGWLLIIGSLRVLTDLPLKDPSSSVELIQQQHLQQWLPGLLIAALLSLAGDHRHKVIAFPTVILLSALVFYSYAFYNGQTLQQLIDDGWLLGGQLQESSLISVQLYQLEWHNLVWHAITAEMGNIASIFFLSAISVLITISAIELSVQQDFDIDRELKITGVVNIFSGLLGGTVSFHSLSLTNLSLNLGNSGRWVGIIAALLCGGTLFFGLEYITYLPRPLLGGLLAYLGITFLREWLFSARKKLPLSEYLLIPLIMIIIAVSGFLEGIFIGLIMAVILFVIHYSKIGAVKFKISGADRRSFVERPPRDNQYLNKQGNQFQLVVLQGFLFFGTTRKLLMQIKQRIEHSEKITLKYIIYDFKHVTGIDYSAAINFVKIRQLANQHGVRVIFSRLPPDFRKRIENTDNLNTGSQNFIYFEDLDHALEWCENKVLLDISDNNNTQDSILENFLKRLDSHQNRENFMGYLEKITLPADVYLMKQGEESNDLYFVEQGSVSIYLESETGEKLRLRKTEKGTMIGELGFYLHSKRSASVLTEENITLYRLSTHSLQKMELQQPSIALQFHRFMAEFSADRILTTTRTISNIME